MSFVEEASTKKPSKKARRKTTAKKKVKAPVKKTKAKAKTTKKDEVMKLLSRRKTPIKTEDVAKKAGITLQTARRYLYYLKKEGKVVRKGDGWVKK